MIPFVFPPQESAQEWTTQDERRGAKAALKINFPTKKNYPIIIFEKEIMGDMVFEFDRLKELATTTASEVMTSVLEAKRYVPGKTQVMKLTTGVEQFERPPFYRSGLIRLEQALFLSCVTCLPISSTLFHQ